MLTIVAADSPNVPPSELSALQNLYDSTNGDYWIWSNFADVGVPWNFTGDARPCTNNPSFNWEGILCSFEAANNSYHVQQLLLPGHNLTGTIPTSIDQLPRLTRLVLPSNSLQGHIPSSIGNLLMLRVLILHSNAFTGSIPNTLTQLNSLHVLNLNNNDLAGPIPSSVAEWTELRRLDFSDNYLTGTIPPDLGKLTELMYLILSSNLLLATLPPELGNLTNLLRFEIGENDLYGSIPATYTNFVNVSLFHLDDNMLTGNIPHDIGKLQKLMFLDLGDNQFTGPIPESIGTLSELALLHAHDNFFTGTLPTSLGGLTSVVQMYLSVNLLIGSIPTTLSRMVALQDLQIHDNILTGNINNIVNATLQTQLESVQLQNNQLTGPLPVEIMRLPSLISLVLGVNCFRGDFPPELCRITSMRNLVLDGLHSASTCQHKILPGLTPAYTTLHHVFGTIPPCYFSMPSLISLHISGNELSGTLPHHLNVSNSLVDLSLSHNIFDGPIPPAIQERTWYSLDLSHNRFSGTLSQHFGKQIVHDIFYGRGTYTEGNSSLYLQNNRLSGPIPHRIRELGTISVLKGNLFSCNPDKSDLPSHDSDKSKYSCGSTLFDTPYYVWLSLVSTGVAALLLLRSFRTQVDKYFHVTSMVTLAKSLINLSYTVENQPRLKTYNNVCDICQIVCRMSYLCAVLSMLVMAPAYTIVSIFYGTHTYAYAWTVSLDFLSGRVAFGIMFVMLGLTICALLNFYARNIRYNHRNWRAVLSAREQEELEVSEERRALRPATVWERATTYLPMIVLNFAVMIGVNLAFVYVVLYEKSAVVTIAQIVLSMFKLFWNKVGSRHISRYTAHRISQMEAKFPRSEYFTLQLFIAIVNNVGIPCLVVLFTSPACIYNMFVTPTPAESHYTSLECDFDDELNCPAYDTIFHSSTYSPPFIYSYQCSSSFVTYYAGTFVNQCIFSSFGTPIVQFACAPLYRMAPPASFYRYILKRLVPKLLRPVNAGLQVGDIKIDMLHPFFDANQLLLSLLTNFAIMITFGVVFPPLAACMAVTIFSVFFFSRLKLGIFVRAATAANSPGYVAIVDKECQGVGFLPVLHRSIWQLTVVSFLFYTWFLFDMLGNTEGFEGAFWVFFVYPLLPLVILPVHVLLHSDAYLRTRRLAKNEIELVDDDEGERKAAHKNGAGEAEEGVCIEMASMPSNSSSEAINVMHVDSQA